MPRVRSFLRFGVAAALAAGLATAVVAACSSSGGHADFGDGDAEAGPTATTDAAFAADVPNVSDLKARQVKCDGGAKTTISGTVFDPAGQLPLYDVVVYVPQFPVQPIKTGASCDRCGAVASGTPLVATLTDSKGRFTLEDAPTGPNVPLVIQVGKWRRQLTVPNVAACADTSLTDVNATRLPRKKSEGDMPQIALVTGCDAMECFLRNIGIDDSEFGAPGSEARVHVYQGVKGGTVEAGSPPAETLWSDPKTLAKYDVALFACECDVHPENKPPEALKAVHDYASAGGRLFMAHYHYYWLQDGGADFHDTATWTYDDKQLIGPDFRVDTTFPKGEALADWLVNAGATPDKLDLNLGSTPYDVRRENAGTQRWIYEQPLDGGGTQAPIYMTFNTPVGVDESKQCGRVVFTDLHVSANDDGKVFPAGCTDPSLTPKEKALEFLFFDLSACIQKDRDRPAPPR